METLPPTASNGEQRTSLGQLRWVGQRLGDRLRWEHSWILLRTSASTKANRLGMVLTLTISSNQGRESGLFCISFPSESAVDPVNEQLDTSAAARNDLSDAGLFVPSCPATNPSTTTVHRTEC